MSSEVNVTISYNKNHGALFIEIGGRGQEPRKEESTQWSVPDPESAPQTQCREDARYSLKNLPSLCSFPPAFISLIIPPSSIGFIHEAHRAGTILPSTLGMASDNCWQRHHYPILHMEKLQCQSIRLYQGHYFWEIFRDCTSVSSVGQSLAPELKSLHLFLNKHFTTPCNDLIMVFLVIPHNKVARFSLFNHKEMGRENHINRMPFICECTSYIQVQVQPTSYIQVQVQHSWESLGKCLTEIFSHNWSLLSPCEEIVTACLLQRMIPTQRAQPPKLSPEGLFLWRASTKTVTVKYLEMLLSGMVPGPQPAPDLRFPPFS